MSAAHSVAAASQGGVSEWWRGAAIYQVYPRSFADSNDDGIGDLAGVTARLDYIAALGVDAVWLSPFFTSPMDDFGYDVSDYCGVDPIFGTIDDFDALVARAHDLGLRVIIDQVYSHTSNQHPWFQESRASRDNPKADWYVWADPKPDGGPPNNWQSVFGGPAWTWDARRGQYYLHNFLSSQPNLNGRNPAVQDALLEVARFWLERGVDGFRLDAINFIMCDPHLRDNPPAPPTNAPRTRSFDFQLHIHNQSQPEIPAFLERVRALVDSYVDGFTVAEVGGEGAEREMKLFTAGDNRLHSAYGFNFLYAAELTPALVEGALGQWPAEQGMGWPSWAFENHDAPRAVSRWVAPEYRAPFARMKMLLLASMRGNIIIYQGEELGLTQVDIPFDRLLDPEAIANWPLTLSRDGARTPMPWYGDRPHGGFSATEPWLPLGEDHASLAIDRQQLDPQSQLAFTRSVIALREAHPALRTGEVRILHASGTLLALERLNGERLLCVFNMGAGPVTYGASTAPWRELLATAPVARDAAGFTLPPYSGFVATWQENDGDR